MGISSGTSLPTCPSSRHCADWARVYLKYCLCSMKDGAALSLGLVSVISWGVAEVPQIISNYKQKSTEGLSVAFLMTWIVGDLFNLIGCFLEPATLPTQFYMALLYTITTLALTGQTVYYGHIYQHFKAKKSRVASKAQKHQRGDNSIRESLLRRKDDEESKHNNLSDVTIPMPSSPIPVNANLIRNHGSGSSGTDFYYVSARSLSRSPLPTAGTWSTHLWTRTPPRTNHQRETLNSEIPPAQSAPSSITKNSLAVAPWTAFFLCMYTLHLFSGSASSESPNGIVIHVGRKLLQLADDTTNSSLTHGNGSGIGSFLGWAMAIIYMGGRLPQICLNIKRGNTEGLNPLMFTFALVGNSTYVGSILVNSLEWSRIKPNLPWLVDAGGCVLLDGFILLQFLYFHLRKPKEAENTDKE